MIRRVLLIGFGLVAVLFLWALLPDVVRSWKTGEPEPSEPQASEPQPSEPDASPVEETPVL